MLPWQNYQPRHLPHCACRPVKRTAPTRKAVTSHRLCCFALRRSGARSFVRSTTASLLWAPAKNQRSVFRGERRCSGTREFCRFRRNEGCGTCIDKVAQGVGTPTFTLYRSSARRRNRRALVSALAGVARSEAERAGRGAGIVQVCSAKQQKTRLNGERLPLPDKKVFLLDRPRPVLFFKKENGGRNRSPAGMPSPARFRTEEDVTVKPFSGRDSPSWSPGNKIAPFPAKKSRTIPRQLLPGDCFFAKNPL